MQKLSNCAHCDYKSRGGGLYVNINIASTTGWLCEAGKDDRGRCVERGFRTRTRLTKSPQNLLWDTIEPQYTHPMAPGRLAASLGRYLGARPKHVYVLAQRGIYVFIIYLQCGFSITRQGRLGTPRSYNAVHGAAYIANLANIGPRPGQDCKHVVGGC